MRKAEEEACVELSPGINVELDENGQVIGIEILNASKIFGLVSKSLKQKKVLQSVLYRD